MALVLHKISLFIPWGSQSLYHLKSTKVSWFHCHYTSFPLRHSDVIMDAMASQITSLTIVYSTVYSGADQRKHQSFASLAFVRGIHRSPVNPPHKGPVTRKTFPFDDVIMSWLGACHICVHLYTSWCAILVDQCTKHHLSSWLACNVTNWYGLWNRLFRTTVSGLPTSLTHHDYVMT